MSRENEIFQDLNIQWRVLTLQEKQDSYYWHGEKDGPDDKTYWVRYAHIDFVGGDIELWGEEGGGNLGYRIRAGFNGPGSVYTVQLLDNNYVTALKTMVAYVEKNQR